MRRAGGRRRRRRGVLWLVVGLPIEVAAAAGLLFGVFAHLVEDYVADQQAASIETQLAAAIYLMVGSLRAGASLLAAFESALEEVGPPLRPYFQEVAGRIRLGDDPRSAVSDLQRHVPLETFRLFATSLADSLGGRRQPGDDAVDRGTDGSRSHRAVAPRARAGRRIARVGGGRPRHRVCARHS